ncbi:hypothetical protein INT48_007299 [Thamnidium elegans]|uniref:Phosphoglycerate mutase n=1 Tax=Thamnidium elegans TaxID=101142 RepID=A0A8H7SPW7_9FUNG|nr:hypothetical protein INT48_007299 [Thamnidium elegans]
MSQPLYNHLPQTLKNHYIIQRHGHSLANEEKLICSNPAIAIPPSGGPLNTGYGLHEKGKIQVKERTIETAEIIQNVLNQTALNGKIAGPIREMELRERYYGDYDMTSDDNYNLCWEDDKSSTHGENSKKFVESPSQVCDRATRFIQKLENEHEGKIIILVAHGDICQIMLTAFKRIEAWRHREIEHVDTANFRDTLDILEK